jgi:cytochrome c oxidase subunit 2
MRSIWRVSLAAALALASMRDPPAVAAQEKVIAVTAERFKFTPSVIELKLGETVVLELTTLDRKHGFQAPDLNVDESVEPGKITRVRIAPTKAGTFPFHCTVFCGSGHEEMAGEIVVKP